MKYYLSILMACFGLLVMPMEALEIKRAVAHSIDTASWTEVVEYAREHLPQEGYLIAKSDGYCYVKVSDEYIHTLFPMLDLEEEGYRKPPYFRSEEATGAHISVIYENENVIPDELGQIFQFELNQIVIVKVSREKTYAILQVTAPELEKLRCKYGLKPKLQGHEFHITLALKKSRHS
jgi:hypothetical protein